MMIVTDNAAKKIAVLLGSEGRPAEDGLRIGVTGGGCNGFQYIMEFDSQKDGDNIFQNGDSRVFVDPKSLMFVDGSVVEYTEGLQNAGFVIQNPQSSGSCGCGLSFSM